MPNIFVEKIHKRAYLMKFVGKRLENGPPQIMSLFLCLFRVSYIKRTTYKNLHLSYIQYRKPFANRLENTLSGANPYWMMEWRTPCTMLLTTSATVRKIHHLGTLQYKLTSDKRTSTYF